MPSTRFEDEQSKPGPPSLSSLPEEDMKESYKKAHNITDGSYGKTPGIVSGDRQENQVIERSTDRPSSDVSLTLDGIFHWGLVAVAFFAPFMILRHIQEFADLPQSAFIQVGALFLFFVWLLKCVVSKRCLILMSPLNLPVLAFVLWSLASILYAHNKHEGFSAWRPWAASALMFFLVMNGSHEKKHLVQILAVIFISGSLCGLLGIAQHLFGFTWVPQVVPPAATFANKNVAVHFIVLTFPLALGFITNSKRRVWAWMAGAASCLMVVFILYTRTRAAWVAVGVEILLLIVLLARERIRNRGVSYWSRNNGIAVALALAVFFVMINLGPKGFTWRSGEIISRIKTMISYEVEPLERQDSARENIALRIAVWRNTIEMIKDHPWVGLGLGNHKVFYPLYHGKMIKDRKFSVTSQLRRVHNDFLQAFAELGVVGMLLLGWTGFVWIRVTLRLTSSAYSSDVRFWAIGIALGIVGLLVNALFSFPFRRAIPPFYLMVLAGILASFHESQDRRFYAIRQRWVVLCSCVLVFVGLIWVVRFHYLGIRYDRHLYRLMQLERSGDWKGIIARGKQYPVLMSTRSLMGRAYIETGNYEKGIETLKKLVEAYPNFLNAFVNMGVAYERMGDHANALQTYERVLFIKPDYPTALNSMANIYIRQGNLGKALERFKSVAELDPGNSIVHYNIGVLEMRNRRYQEAAAAFERAVKLKPRWAVARKNLGIVYFQFLDRKNEGVEHLRKALKLDPDMEDAARIREMIRTPVPQGEKTS